MKFIFFGSTKEINLLTHGFDKNSYSILDEIDPVAAKAKEGDYLVFINFDFNAEQAMILNNILKEVKNVKRIVYSKTRDLKKEKIPADEYILGPLNKASFQGAVEEVMGGKTLSSLTLGSKGLDSDVNKSIQDAFDDAFQEEKPIGSDLEVASPETSTPEAAPPEGAPTETATPEIPEAPAIEAAPTESPSPDSIKDEESQLEFSVGGMTLSELKKEVASTSPAGETPPAEEISATQTPATEIPATETPVSEIPGSEKTATPESTEKPEMTLDDGSSVLPGSESQSQSQSRPGDLEIPSLDEGPSLELGGADDVAAASTPVDQGLDLDQEAPAAPTTSAAPIAESQPVQEEIIIPPKPPATLQDASSDPSMEFTAVIKQEDHKRENESQEFKFSLPKAADRSTPKETSPEKTVESPKETEIEVSSPISRSGDESVVRLEAIIRALRDERESLLKELNDNKELKSRLLGENLNLEATAEELKVELSIIKKKNEEEFHEGAFGKKILNEKLRLAEEKNKRLQKDLDILSQKEKVDINKIVQKEKELEGQLELLSMDSQNQILIREKKISELKREVDAMEFNMSNLVSREKKLRQEKLEVEEKLNKIMRTMRNSIEFLEEEIDGNQKLFKELKK